MDRWQVALVQMPHGASLGENLAAARAWLERARDAGAHLALLPEYWFAPFPSSPPDLAADAPRVRALLQDASRDLGIAVSGNVLQRLGGTLWNIGLAYEDGRLVLEQPKIHPMPREAASGVAGGDALEAGHVLGHGAGMLVCADILYPEAACILALQGAEVLLNPVMSPWRAEDDTRGARDAIFVARAYDSGAFVLKTGGFRHGDGAAAPDLEGGPPAVAGRSLAAAPWGVLAKAKGDFEEELLVVELDFARLQRFREHKARFPPRRPEAYAGLL